MATKALTLNSFSHEKNKNSNDNLNIKANKERSAKVLLNRRINGTNTKPYNINHVHVETRTSKRATTRTAATKTTNETNSNLQKWLEKCEKTCASLSSKYEYKKRQLNLEEWLNLLSNFKESVIAKPTDHHSANENENENENIKESQTKQKKQKENNNIANTTEQVNALQVKSKAKVNAVENKQAKLNSGSVNKTQKGAERKSMNKITFDRELSKLNGNKVSTEIKKIPIARKTQHKSRKKPINIKQKEPQIDVLKETKKLPLKYNLKKEKPIFELSAKFKMSRAQTPVKRCANGDNVDSNKKALPKKSHQGSVAHKTPRIKRETLSKQRFLSHFGVATSYKDGVEIGLELDEQTERLYCVEGRKRESLKNPHIPPNTTPTTIKPCINSSNPTVELNLKSPKLQRKQKVAETTNDALYKANRVHVPEMPSTSITIDYQVNNQKSNQELQESIVETTTKVCNKIDEDYDKEAERKSQLKTKTANTKLNAEEPGDRNNGEQEAATTTEAKTLHVVQNGNSLLPLRQLELAIENYKVSELLASEHYDALWEKENLNTKPSLELHQTNQKLPSGDQAKCNIYPKKTEYNRSCRARKGLSQVPRKISCVSQPVSVRKDQPDVKFLFRNRSFANISLNNKTQSQKSAVKNNNAGISKHFQSNKKNSKSKIKASQKAIQSKEICREQLPNKTNDQIGLRNKLQLHSNDKSHSKKLRSRDALGIEIECMNMKKDDTKTGNFSKNNAEQNISSNIKQQPIIPSHFCSQVMIRFVDLLQKHESQTKLCKCCSCQHFNMPEFFGQANAVFRDTEANPTSNFVGQVPPEPFQIVDFSNLFTEYNKSVQLNNNKQQSFQPTHCTLEKSKIKEQDINLLGMLVQMCQKGRPSCGESKYANELWQRYLVSYNKF